MKTGKSPESKEKTMERPTRIIEIAEKKIGLGQPTFIIAEAGVNHNGSLELAKKLIDVAVAADADAVKFQTFRPELIVTDDAPKAEYQIANTGTTESQIDMLGKLVLQRDFHPLLQHYCAERGIIFLSTPFSEDDADFLDSINVPAFKVSSTDTNNIPFLRHLAAKGKPIIYSTGMSTLAEVREGVEAMRDIGNENIVVLHCTTEYPPRPESLNLKAIRTIEEALLPLNVPVGYSDNGSVGSEADVVAVGLGACVIEKHFTLDKNMPGPDHLASLEPVELDNLVKDIRGMDKTMQGERRNRVFTAAEIATIVGDSRRRAAILGSGVKEPTPKEIREIGLNRRSVHMARDVAAGQVVTRADLIALCPATGGLEPKYILSMVGKRTRRALKKGEQPQLEDIGV